MKSIINISILILAVTTGTSSKGGHDAAQRRLSQFQCRRISSFGGGARRAEEDSYHLISCKNRRTTVAHEIDYVDRWFFTAFRMTGLSGHDLQFISLKTILISKELNIFVNNLKM